MDVKIQATFKNPVDVANTYWYQQVENSGTGGNVVVAAMHDDGGMSYPGQQFKDSTRWMTDGPSDGPIAIANNLTPGLISRVDGDQSLLFKPIDAADFKRMLTREQTEFGDVGAVRTWKFVTKLMYAKPGQTAVPLGEWDWGFTLTYFKGGGPPSVLFDGNPKWVSAGN